MRSIVRWFLRFLYRFGAVNESVLSTPGPVLLVPNHVSWLDWLFLGSCLAKDWRFVTSSATAELSWLHRRIMINRYTFPIDMSSPFAVKRMAEFLEGGGRLVLFAEGRISTTGSLMKLFDGTGFLLHRTRSRVITAHLRGADRLPFVRHGNATQWFPRVTAHFSDLLTPPDLPGASTADARTILTRWLRDAMIRQRFEAEMEMGPATPLQAVALTAKRFPRKVLLEDISRQELKGKRILVGARLLARQWRALLPETSSGSVGVLLPNVNAAPVTVLSLWLAGRVPAVLNFSSGPATLLSCAQLAGLKSLITSRAFLERAQLDLEPLRRAGVELVFLEDVRKSIPMGAKLGSMLRQTFLPMSGLPKTPPKESAVILFTSGSEGVPKGVELTHRNLMANVRQMLAVIDLEDGDRILNALPLFHSFGLTIGTLLPLIRGFYNFLYPSPLHYRIVPAAVYDRACTVMLGANTFLNGYARKAHPYDFRSLRYLFAGAEKVQEATFNTYARRFGVRILEGYGATECSPCLSVNTPADPLFGSAGRLLPGIEFRLEPVDNLSEGGRLLVRGPNVMKGYLNPEANREFRALDGWYDTGDIARIDDHGFVHILGRLKRFAKVSGEMVSLTAVEEALAGAFPQYGLRFEAAVLARPDEDKGEALVAVTNEPKLRLEEVRAVLREKGFSNLSVPREIKSVREIPKLGSGKVNHRELQRIA